MIPSIVARYATVHGFSPELSRLPSITASNASVHAVDQLLCL
jgi:hypothetical protein